MLTSKNDSGVIFKKSIQICHVYYAMNKNKCLINYLLYITEKISMTPLAVDGLLKMEKELIKKDLKWDLFTLNMPMSLKLDD